MIICDNGYKHFTLRNGNRIIKINFKKSLELKIIKEVGLTLVEWSVDYVTHRKRWLYWE